MNTAVPDIWITMFRRCQPAYLKYSILGLPEHRSEGLEHEENLYFNDVNVIFTGSFDRLVNSVKLVLLKSRIVHS